MASLSSLNLTSSLSRSSFSSSSLGFLSPSILSLPIRNYCLRSFPTITTRRISIRALTLDFSGSFFEGGLESDREPPSTDGSTTAVEEKEEPQCPPGLRQYETMAVLRPDMSEEERLALTQKYEELLVAGGGMYVEVFNRGVIPLAYSIKKRNRAGEANTYYDGIYLLFTYFTKPESMAVLETRLKADDDVIRSCSFKIRKRKY
ncbi:30S ribosomal protein S6 alpha, chloroplastic [Cinnamomum micranthum f. kanehirae]|uniref:30S ribosomal protein S6 alpha, chloroplastic n=1 Tax=Cinnamomum micranthum f. kanehirae TaxID=337451 RepID=A0A443Q064_9MAGN|nr:30S ribosomal protein S6 alpha, chloroplastic [Cinnamomum micranthum f. kanehirae]